MVTGGYSEKLLNIVLRTLTLGVRFLFIIGLARFADPATVGHFGLFVATISYAMLFAGLDFYTYANREVARAPAQSRGGMLRSQATLSIAVYVLVLPLLIWLLLKLDWPLVMLWWFVPILLLDHINQEIYRLLVTLSQQVWASIILFLRQGSWGLVLIGTMVVAPQTRDLSYILPAWAIAGLVAAALGVWRLRQLKMGSWRVPFDWAWVRKGLAISGGFLIATLALRATQTIDRYWLEALTDVQTLAAYVLYFGIAAALIMFLDAGVFAFAYPTLIRLYHEDRVREASRVVRIALLQTVIVTSSFALISWLVLPYLLAWIGNPVYSDQLALYAWLLGAMILNALGLVPHYALYAKGHDRPIIISHILGLVTFVATSYAFSFGQPNFAIPIGLVASFLVILISKAIAYLNCVRGLEHTFR